MEIMLKRPLQAVRRKLQRERLIKGVALLIGYCLLASLLTSLLLTQANFSDQAMFWSRIVALVGLAAIAGRFILYPLLRRPSRRQVARFLEERHPELQERVSTAVEVENRELKIHPEISLLIQQDATKQLRTIPKPRFYWPHTSTTSLIAAIVCVLLFGVLYLGGPDAYRYSLSQLLAGWMDGDARPLYQVIVEPGNVKVAERADLQVTAQLVGFQSRDVRLFANYEGQPNWEQATMAAALDSDAFHFLFFDIRDHIQYYVEADGIRSDIFSIEVSEVATLTQFSATLNFPPYTGMEPVTLEDHGNVSALEGTSVQINAQTDQPVSRALLRFEEAGDIELTLDESGAALTGSFKVTRDDFYRLFLANSEGVLNPASDEFFVERLEDQPPTVSFNEPGRDRRVTNIEEVFAEVKAEDDHGLRKLELRFALNGGEEQTVRLDFRRGSRSQTSSHTFYLEEFDLEPGDFVTYYAAASDALTETASDMYFLEIEPYDREFYQSDQQGGGNQPGDGLDLAKQQKQIIVATFALTNEKHRYTATEFKGNSQTLGLIEQRLQTQAQTIIDRIMRRGAAASDPKFQKMVEFMQIAMEHMATAEAGLNEVRPKDALPEEQKAYLQLLRAEMLFKEMQVSMSRNQPGGGGGSSAEQLADLVDLELDRTKNQYETLQQNQAQQQDQQLDEALEKLKELARRQEREVQRRRQQAMQGGGSGGSLSEEQLLEQVEELARQLSRLSRQKQDQQLNQIARELQRAARNLRQARQSGQSTQQATMQAQQALERLQEAQEKLQNQRQNQMRNNLEELRKDAERLAQNQEDVVEGITDLERRFNQGDFDRDQWRQLLRDKGEMQADLQGLESQLHQSARRLESNQPEAARRLKQAGNDIRDDRLQDKMQEGRDFLSRGLMNMARKREEDIEEDLQQLAQRIQAAEQALGQGGENQSEEKLQRALSEAGSLVDKLESIEQRARSEQQGEQEDEQEGRQGQQQGEQQGREGQPGNQQGQNPQGQNPQPQQGRGGGGSSRDGSEQRANQPSQSELSSPLSNGGMPINPRQLEREWRERIGEAERLQELLEDNPELQRDAGRLAQQMRRLDSERIYNDAEELARLKGLVIDGLHQLELEINQALGAEGEEVLRLVNDADVPPQFRQRVAEYYRKLSKRKPNN